MDTNERAAWAAAHVVLQAYAGLAMATAMVDDAMEKGPSVGTGAPAELSSWLRKRGLPCTHQVAFGSRRMDLSRQALQDGHLLLAWLVDFPSPGERRWAVLLSQHEKEIEVVVVLVPDDAGVECPSVAKAWTGHALVVERQLPSMAMVVGIGMDEPLPKANSN